MNIESTGALQAQAAADDAMRAAIFSRSRRLEEPGFHGCDGAPEEGGGACSMDRVKATSALNEWEQAVSDRASALEKQANGAERKMEGLAEKNAAMRDGLAASKADLVKFRQGAALHIKGVHAEIAQMRTDLDSAQNKTAIALILNQMKELKKTLNRGGVKAFTDHVKAFNASCAHLGKTSSGRRDRARQEIEAQPAPPLWTMLVEDLEDGMFNCGKSVFECKGGLRPACLTISDSGKYQALINQPLVKKGLKALADSLKGGATSAVQPLDAGKLTLKRLEQGLEVLVGSDLRSTIPLPKQDWAATVFRPQLFGMGAMDLNVTWPPYGMMSANLVLGGAIVFAGLPTDKIAGSTYKEKRTNVLRMSPEELNASIADGGWMCRFTDGSSAGGESILTIPTGFCLITAARDARIMQWPFTADAMDGARARNTLSNMLQCFPEWKASGTGNLQLAQHLLIPGF